MALTLAEIYQHHRNLSDGLGWGDKGTVHSYIEVYEELFAPHRHTVGNVLEIGILNGSSLLMWEQYFAKASVIGMDVTDQPYGFDLRPLIYSGHKIVIGNAANPDEVERHFVGMKFAVVIDDASHNLDAQLQTYRNFRGRMAGGGLYVIEDVADIDHSRQAFVEVAENVEIIDRRGVKNRFDDVLVVIR